LSAKGLMSVHYNTDLNTPPSTEHALRAVKGEKKNRVVRS
jgi:hypothetical protein